MASNNSIFEGHNQPRPGPIAAYLEGFRTWLASQGYKPVSLRIKLRCCRDLDHWLKVRNINLPQIDEEVIATWLESSARRLVTARSTGQQLLEWLRFAVESHEQKFRSVMTLMCPARPIPSSAWTLSGVDSIGVVHQLAEDRVRRDWTPTDILLPHGQVAGHHSGADITPVIKDIRQVAAVFRVLGSQSQSSISRTSNIGDGQLTHQHREAGIEGGIYPSR